MNFWSFAAIGVGTAACILASAAFGAQWVPACLDASPSKSVDILDKRGRHVSSWPSPLRVEVQASDRHSWYIRVRDPQTNKVGYVREGVVEKPERCDELLDGVPPQEPTPIPPEEPSPTTGFSGGDPFNCGGRSSRKEQDRCNLGALRDLARKGQHSLSYDEARRQLFQFVDVFTDGQGRRVVMSVYSPDELFPVGRGVPKNGVNTEHTVPQSVLRRHSDFSSSRSDLHHLFPCEEGINSERSSQPFAECSSEDLEHGISCDAGPDGGFEPPDQHKGLTARAVFYISMRYDVPLDSSEESVLRRWMKQFPVTSEERERMDRVRSVQGNVNPFVEHPEWVDLVSDF